MSTHNIGTFDLLKPAASVCVLIAIVAGVAWISCGGDDDSEGDLDEYFLRDVATVEAMGLPVYWLGREFTVDGLVFRGPHVAEFGAEVEGGGIRMSYVLVGGNTPAYLTIYSRDAWELVKDRMMNPRLPGVTRRTVSVQDRDGELILQSAGARPLNAIWLILDLSVVVGVADTNSGGAIYPGGPDYNPFINNPDLLIQVMEDLRPYPE
jgi:hypothetical protein